MTTEKTSWRLDRIAMAAGATFAVAALLYYLMQSPPQMGAAPEVFETVDALYTAVRNQDPGRVGECEQRLHRYRDAGLLPAEASGALDRIIETARAKQWTSATKSLYDFMIVQRREGPGGQGKSKPQ